jgi:hypothetical protein
MIETAQSISLFAAFVSVAGIAVIFLLISLGKIKV